MKVWLNNLKEGDIFYHIIMNHIYKCKHLGDAHNMNFKMSRIKYKIIDGDNTKLLFDIFGDDHEAFVNQYVYDDYESALEELKKEIVDEIDNLECTIEKYKKTIDDLESQIKRLKELKLTYAKQDLEKN
jgi:predicted RNase H-like nuclease (RuvC/YqgF family)